MDDTRRAHLTALTERLGYCFDNVGLLNTALTHTSYVKGENRRVPHSERLEFLGDAVLETCVSRRLYDCAPPLAEGVMTRLRAMVVREEALCAAARRLTIGPCLLLSRGEEHTQGRDKPSILADALEAVIGAVFVDGGFDAAQALVDRILGEALENALGRLGRDADKDYKTRLQEYVQQERLGQLSYVTAGESGPDHRKEFAVEVLLDGKPLGRGTGGSKLEAGQRAAKLALERLRS